MLPSAHLCCLDFLFRTSDDLNDMKQHLRKPLPTWNISRMSDDKTKALVKSVGLDCVDEVADDLEEYTTQLPPVKDLVSPPYFVWPSDDEEKDTPAAAAYITDILYRFGVPFGRGGFKVVDVHSEPMFNLNVGEAAVLTWKTDVIVVCLASIAYYVHLCRLCPNNFHPNVLAGSLQDCATKLCFTIASYFRAEAA